MAEFEGQSFHTKREGKKSCQTTAEYCRSVRAWLEEAYRWQCAAAMFPYWMSQQMAADNSRHSTSNGSIPLQREEQHAQMPAGVVYRIPPLWKRFVAEMLDFVLLFILKLALTFIAIDVFKIIDLDKYNFEHFLKTMTTTVVDYRIAFEMTSEIVLLELMHRIAVCVFEALCLQRGHVTPGGATPGKSLMGLKVVSSEWVTEAMNERVRVHPGGDLGLLRSVVRSLVKNFTIAFFFPVCFTLFYFPFSRTMYDMMAGSVVVEEDRVDRRG